MARNSLEGIKDLDNMDIPSKSLHGVASEVNESRSAVKEAYSKMEKINEILVKKLVLLDSAGGVPNVKKSLEELNNASEEYWEKWEILRRELLMKVDLAVEQKVTSGGPLL